MSDPGRQESGPASSAVPFASVYLRIVLDASAADAAARIALLEGTGLGDPLQQAWPATVPLSSLRTLLQNAARGRQPGWHLALVPRLDAAVHGALGFAAWSAPTLAAALEVLLTFGGGRFPFLTFQMRPSGSSVRLVCGSVRGTPVDDALLLELATLACANFIVQYVARDPAGLGVLWPGPPRRYRDALARATSVPVLSGRSVYAVEWPRAWLALASPLADAGLHRLSVERCREQLARVSGRTPLEEAVRQALMAAGGRSPGLASIAAARHVAPRTLMRQLRQAGTSYQRILDEVRATLAADLLRDTAQPLAAIGERLGFSDTSNFSRAFRSWYGCAPGVFRERSR